jgi:hypothetical protein
MFEILLILAIAVGVYKLLRSPTCPCKDCEMQCFIKLDELIADVESQGDEDDHVYP